MAIEALEVHDFRCFSCARLTSHEGTNLIVGPNGAGKTSVLEALHVIGTGRSFRVRELRPLVRHHQSHFEIAARLDSPPHTLEARGGSDGLELQLNGQTLRGTAELAATVPMQALHPELHALIEGSPEGRRRFLDWGAFHVKQSFLEIWRRYHRALRQRNAALKQGLMGRDRAVWDDELVHAGELVDSHRRQYVERLSGGFSAIAASLLGVSAELTYRRGWKAGLAFVEALRASAERERMLQATQVGPHRADLDVQLDSAPARYRASRGQQKILAVSLGLAQAQVIAEAAQRRMVMLLDDPIAEIDGERAAQLMAQVVAIPAQRFVTGLTSDSFSGVADRVFHVERGELKQVI